MTLRKQTLFGLLCRLAEKIIRGPEAPYVLGDLEEAYDRDLRRGLSPRAARRRYLRNAVRSALSVARAWATLPRFEPSFLDVKLGFRMLTKQPWLTAVAVFALAIGIPVGLVPFHIGQIDGAALPFDEGERIVRVRTWNFEPFRLSERVLHDFEVWREELTTFEAVGAFRSSTRNVISEDGRLAPLQGAEVTGSTFEILRVSPVLGRWLIKADERPSSPDVVAIGWHVWQQRLGGDPDVLGRTIRIGGTPYEVVGVMPDGFLFPDRDHYWLPLRVDPLQYAPGDGPTIEVFGRLADGARVEEANAELIRIGNGLADRYPATHRLRRSEVDSFTGSNVYSMPTFWILQLLALLLLIVACGNVGTLILARNATRIREIAVRTALGASRRRVVSQLFVEALVLALVATGVGLALGNFAAERLQVMLAPRVPFWFDLTLTLPTIVAALLLAALSATLAGVLPALKATGRVQQTLQRANAGASGIRFGGISTVLIVSEVALAVAFLGVATTVLPSVLRDPGEGLGVAAEDFLVGSLHFPSPAASGGRTGDSQQSIRGERPAVETKREILRRLIAEPGVLGVAVGSAVPGDAHQSAGIEVEGEDGKLHRVHAASVDVDFFKALGQPVLRGRDFDLSDVSEASPEARTAVVNTSFVDRVLRGTNPIGRRIRYPDVGGGEPGPWFEIVGVIGHLGMNEINPSRASGFYRPERLEELNPLRFAIHLSTDPEAFIPRLRAIVADVDSEGMILQPMRPDENAKLSERRVGAWWLGLLVAVIAATAIVLFAAGLYALVSFTVSERTREIGIRTALGAQRGSIIGTVARRAALQLGIGVAAGAGLYLLLRRTQGLATNPAVQEMNQVALLVALASVTLAIGLLACLPAVLRGLRIRPVDALKAG